MIGTQGPADPGLFPEPATPAGGGGPGGAAGSAAGFRRMPEEVRALGRSWDTLVGQVPGLTPELERDFRFGQTVFPFAGGFRIGGSLKGGSSTMWRPATEGDCRAYTAWKEREGVPGSVDDLVAFENLAGLLADSRVDFWNQGHQSGSRRPAEYVPGRGWIYRMVLDILNCLPAEHLGRPQFSALQLGGWGPASAKASAYENGRVFIYDFALGGARRTLIGLFLHEMGHAHEAALSPEAVEEISARHTPISERGALLGLEFLLDAESRKVYQQFLVSEFIAETYVAYTAAGPTLRELVASTAGEAGKAWREVYDIYRRSFGGIEYD
ncbi:MAG TPA: hypothetical protein PK280_03060 [Planctomycetota bacterium]|nr:hypothetical protein [Planctomycetota bacterium]